MYLVHFAIYMYDCISFLFSNKRNLQGIISLGNRLFIPLAFACLYIQNRKQWLVSCKIFCMLLLFWRRNCWSKWSLSVLRIIKETNFFLGMLVMWWTVFNKNVCTWYILLLKGKNWSLYWQLSEIIWNQIITLLFDDHWCLFSARNIIAENRLLFVYFVAL